MQRPAISKTFIQQTNEQEKKMMLQSEEERINCEFYCGICKVIFMPVAKTKKQKTNTRRCLENSIHRQK